jgi:hypothetical protein
VNINLHIERLVLDGIAVEPHQRAELKAAVESELSRLLVSNGIDAGVQTDKSSRAVSGGLISIDNTHKPTRTGQQIGEAVYRGIGK